MTKRQTSILDNLQSLITDLKRFEVDIRAALGYNNGSHTFDDVVAGVLRGELHFYPLADSFLIMEVWAYPRCKKYGCFLAGGNLTTLTDVIPTMAERARALGCDAIELHGRRGWARALVKHGFDFQFVTMSLKVEQ